MLIRLTLVTTLIALFALSFSVIVGTARGERSFAVSQSLNCSGSQSPACSSTGSASGLF
ncbi:hypothetical protein [Consotaella aegiceratis]|uniref:hypothetical protein n=1 Tax=Consotaella aegiceratis TaxID=3097961 RepID=UPI002F40DED1